MTCLNPKTILDPVYYARWREIVEHPEVKFFKWGEMYNSQYLLIDPIQCDEEFLSQLKEATESCGLIYQKAVKFVQQDQRFLALLGIPPDAAGFSKLDYDERMPVTVIGRFDFGVDSENNLKMLEFNSDTPTGLVESAELNGLIAKLNNKKDPNWMLQGNVKTAFQNFLRGKHYNNIVFTSLGWHVEDQGTVLAEMAYSGLKARYVPLDKLMVTEEGLIDDLGNKVDLLYRLYPVEWFAMEEDGVKLLNLVTRGELDIINPPAAFIAQSKVMQAVIWELGANTNYFSIKEREIIKRYFLPTYLDDKYFKEKSYIAKPALGREGGGVRIYNTKGELNNYSNQADYEGNLIYQEKVELPRLSVDTWSGEYSGRAVVSGFLIGGVYSGIFVRLGPEITGNMAYFTPVVLK